METPYFRTLYRIALVLIVLAIGLTGLTISGQWIVFDTKQASATANMEELRAYAGDIRPTIATIEQLRALNAAYPAKASDLQGHLPPGVLADATNAGDEDALSLDVGHGVVWVYTRDDDGQGFELTRHLANGGNLTALSQKGKLTWRYAATEDEDAVDVALPP